MIRPKAAPGPGLQDFKIASFVPQTLEELSRSYGQEDLGPDPLTEYGLPTDQHLPPRIKKDPAKTFYTNAKPVKADAEVGSMITKQGRVWLCRMCGKSADTDRAREHLRLVHVKTHLVGLDHACNLCGVLFKSRNRVMSHIAMAHTATTESSAPYL